MYRVPFIVASRAALMNAGVGTPSQGSLSPSPRRFSFFRRFTAQPGQRGLDRFKRTPAERMLLTWVVVWIMMAGVATTVMVVLLFEVKKYPVVDEQIRERLHLHHLLTREKYSSNDEVSKRIIQDVSSDKIRDALKKLARKSRTAAYLRETVQKYWSDSGMDAVDLVSYHVLMSEPDASNENKVQLYKDDQLILTAANEEVPAPGSHMRKSAAYLAYAHAGDVKEAPVYVNYGRESDYASLEGAGISVSGKIGIARLGKISRADKLRFAEKAGAAGLVLFLDPQNVGPRNEGERPFPDSWWVGGSALQRGSVAYVGGDPMTPGYPSREGMYRVPVNKANLPRIPCQPIGYDDARAIFAEMDSNQCWDNWRPKLQIPCHIQTSSNVKLRIVVNNKLRIGEVTNVIGRINGSEEIDRLVIVGNHMDSLSTSSASDPLLGVSQLVEMARVLGLLHKAGWKPRRTLVFTLWDGEEQGMLGSTEWVEDHMACLQARAVLYIATELLTGDTFRPRASWSVAPSIRHAASIVPHYKQANMSLLDVWSGESREDQKKKPPIVRAVVGRSDDAPFVFSAGVPTAYLFFSHRYNDTNLYPAYHTAYDTFEMVEKYLDPGFYVSRMLAQLTASLARVWADRRLLPFELRELAYYLRVGLDSFVVRHKNLIAQQNIHLSSVHQAVEEFTYMAERFMNWTVRLDPINPIAYRIANDILMSTEKSFVSPGGMPTRGITHRNVVFSPEGLLFPGIEDAIKRTPFDKDGFGLQTALLAEAIYQASQHLSVAPY